ncbi:WD40 repeat-like protein [Piromyces finnis]|uniref:WD40 repeat-like protein n=1 Tax=Piromyces finnis TaxID=1754191 RepID=A0A1Y1VD83_9FUNG|nr:WD40 repeat-like protein [Piromyces finnis]|eukprot:ORX53292.1 WD40 repeat-like protein [Piromyces finnis]
MLATAASYYIKLWNLNSDNDVVSVKEKSSCMPHGSSNVLCMEWTQDSSLIGTAGSDGCLVLCIPETGIFSEVIPTGRLKNSKNDEIYSMKFYNQSNLIVFGGSGKIVKCWDRQHNKFLNNFLGHTKTIKSMDINHSEMNISSVSENGDILINSLDGKTSILKNITDNSLNKIIYSKNSNSQLFTIDDHGFLYSYDTINLLTDSKIKVCDSMSINDVIVSPLNNNILITANEDGTLTFIDYQNKNIVNTYKAIDPLTSVSVKIDGSMLACGTSRGQVLLYDIRMNKQLHKYWAETKSIKTLKFQNIPSNGNRKRTQSILTLENNTLNPQKHILSTESVEAETLEYKTDASNFDISSPSTPTTSKPSSKLASLKTNENNNNQNNNITSNLLSVFSSNKYQPPSNLSSSFSPLTNPPFNYDFSKNKKSSTYTNTLLNKDEDFPNTPIRKIEENKLISKDKGKGNSVLTFTDFLKNNYSKSNTTEVVTTSKDILSTTSPNSIHPSTTNDHVSSHELSSSKPVNKVTPKLTVVTMNSKEDPPKKLKGSHNIKEKKDRTDDENTSTNPTNTFNDIWLNPEVFAPHKDQDVTLTTSELSSIPTEKENTSSSSKLLPSTINFGEESQPNDALYDRYVNENSNILKEKLQNNIKEELQKNGISIHDENNTSLDEGISSISNKILESVVEEGLQELKGFLRNDIKNMHLEIISQFHFQKYEIEKMFKEEQEKIGPLLTELQKLREENERLKCQIYKTS